MGSTQSKQSKKESNTPGRSKSASPYQEKHNSADSKTPLTQHADFDIPRSLSLNRHISLGAQSNKTNVSSPAAIQSPPTIEIDEQEGHSDVTRPPPPPQLRRLSELIDPHDVAMDSQIRSPSGNLLAPEQFLVHPDRPKSIRERQEQINARVRAASRAASRLGELENSSDDKPQAESGEQKKAKAKRKWWLCGCFTGR